MGEVIEMSNRPAVKTEPAYVGSLDTLIHRIKEISFRTEGGFLEFGQNLQELSKGSREISENALSASTIMSGDEIRGAISGLNAMIQQLDELFEKTDEISSGSIVSLLAIDKALSMVKKELVHLAETSRNLKMLALSTKIQSTRTGGNAESFLQLGCDITEMSQVVSLKSTDLMKATDALDNLVIDVHQDLKGLREKHQYQTGNVIQGVHIIVEGLTSLNSGYGQEVERIREYSRSIAESLDELVISIQYQDITRQSLERVVGQLGKIQAGAGPVIDPGPDGEEKTKYAGNLLAVGLCKKQTQCLLGTAEKLNEAVKNISGNLNNVIKSIESMALITGHASKESSRFLKELEAGMDSVTEYLADVSQSGKGMSEAMSSLAGTVDGMMPFAGDIEMISSEVGLIALNTRVMAAQKGSGGAGMNVIAQAVQKTAGASEEQRLTLVDLLQEVSSASVALKEDIERVSSGVDTQYDQLVRELGVFLDSLRIMQKRIVAMLGDISARSSGLRDRIDSANQRIQSMEDAYLRIKRTAADLEKIAERLCESIETEELYRFSEGRFDREEISHMGTTQKLALIKDHFSKTGLLECFEEERAAQSIEDVVLFD